MNRYTFRFASPEDAEAILDIYQYYILHTPATFEYEVPTVEEFRKRVETISEVYPYLVCESGDGIAGYAYAHRFKERTAYQWDAELSIYLDQQYLGGRIGTALYQGLMELLTLQNVVNVYGGITLPNPASVRLHEHFGFHLAGIYHKTGFRFGKWQDVALYEKNLCPYPEHPEPIRSIQEIPDAQKKDILANLLE